MNRQRLLIMTLFSVLLIMAHTSFGCAWQLSPGTNGFGNVENDSASDIYTLVEYDSADSIRIDRESPEPVLFVVEKDGKFGVLNVKTGMLVQPIAFDYVGGIIDNYGSPVLPVKKDGKSSYIYKKTGRLVFPFKYEGMGSYYYDLISVYDNGKVGFINKKGELVVPIEFDHVKSFYNGLAAVRKDGKQGFINLKGDIVIPLIYDEVGEFYQKKVARVQIGDQWGLIDMAGKLVLQMKYSSLRDEFHEGLIAVMSENQTWGFVDQDENVVIPYQYEMAGSFSEGLATVYQDGKVGFIDKTGGVVVPLQYDDAEDFSRGLAVVEMNEKRGLVDKNGKVILPCQYSYIAYYGDSMIQAGKRNRDQFDIFNLEGELIVSAVSENTVGWWSADQETGLSFDVLTKGKKHGIIDSRGIIVAPFEYDIIHEVFSQREDLAAAMKNGKWGFINRNGKEVTPFEFEGISYFNEGPAAVKKDGKWGFIGKNCELITAIEYDSICTVWSEGLLSVKKNGRWGFINEAGAVVIPFDYDEPGSFNEGFAIIIKDGETGFINEKGKFIASLGKYQAMGTIYEMFYGGRAFVEKNGKWGFSDTGGNVVVPTVYDEASLFYYGFAAVKQNGKWGFVDENGVVAVPIKYDSVGTIGRVYVAFAFVTEGDKESAIYIIRKDK